MYNRYIPQPDGSYSRRRVPEQNPPQQQPPQVKWQHAPPPCAPEQAPEANFNPPKAKPHTGGNYPRRSRSCPPRNECREPHRETGGSVLDFFRQILPRDFDTGDLLIVLLLLLMAGDCQEDQNSALLTLALYLFL